MPFGFQPIHIFIIVLLAFIIWCVLVVIKRFGNQKRQRRNALTVLKLFLLRQ